MAIQSKDEIRYMNYMKFFGIIYLLIWHAWIRGLNILVISFFLQMFFFISGYFFKDIYAEKPFTFIRKRIISLYIPFVIYCSLLLALNNLFVRFNLIKDSLYISPNNFGYYFLRILTLEAEIQLAGAMWFVSSLFFTSILFCCISAIIKKRIPFLNFQGERESVRFLIIVALFLLGNYLSFIKMPLPRSIDISFVLSLFYYLGYLYRRYEEKTPLNIYLALSAFSTLLICTKFGFPQFGAHRYVDPSFILLCGIAGIYLNIYLSKKFATFKTIAFVDYAGRNTMAILALHFLAFKVVTFIYIYSHDLPLDLLASFPLIKSANQYYHWLYAISGLLLPLAIKYAFDKSYYQIKSFFPRQQNSMP